jgi:hypothetical protein
VYRCFNSASTCSASEMGKAARCERIEEQHPLLLHDLRSHLQEGVTWIFKTYCRSLRQNSAASAMPSLHSKELFSSAPRRGRPPKSKTGAPAPSKKRRTMSAAARNRISEAMKQRWVQRQNKGTTTSKKASGKKGAAPKKSSGRPPMSAEARKKLSELAKQRWAQRRNKA